MKLPVYYTQSQLSNRYVNQKLLQLRTRQIMTSMTRKQCLFFCNAVCTNNNNHLQAQLAFTTIIFILQYVHFWGASTAQPGAGNNDRLQFRKAEDVSKTRKNGNLNNHRICNGKPYQNLAKVEGVLAVQCSQNNGGQSKPPASSAFV
jgi:hypothetical protein